MEEKQEIIKGMKMRKKEAIYCRGTVQSGGPVVDMSSTTAIIYRQPL